MYTTDEIFFGRVPAGLLFLGAGARNRIQRWAGMDMELEGRVPPHSEDAEKSLLGAMMLSREAVMMAVETLVPDDFYSSVHRAIFSAMCALYAVHALGGQRAGLCAHCGRKERAAAHDPRLRRDLHGVLRGGKDRPGDPGQRRKAGLQHLHEAFLGRAGAHQAHADDDLCQHRGDLPQQGPHPGRALGLCGAGPADHGLPRR